MRPRIAPAPLLALCLAGCLTGGIGARTAATDTSTPAAQAAALARGISFPISCDAESQARFATGLFLLHNMMYKQAHAEFAAAVEADSQCAMLHWGVAMTQFHPQWPGEPTAEALRTGAAAVASARAISAEIPAREQGYIEAVATYYRDWQHNDRSTRKARWRETQGKHAAAYPEDAEAQIFFALARLTTADPYDKTYAQQLEAADALERVLEQRPEHPGVMHYLLHAYDNPVHAPRGAAAAQAYERVAPDAPHALHMPSHIYVRLGNWAQVVAWNIRSRASAKRQPAPGGRVSRHFLHALDYLVYGYLQMADDAQAELAAAHANAETEWQRDSGPAAYALAAVPARLALERRAWTEAAALEPRAVPYSWDRYPWAEAITHAARGLGAARRADLEPARQSLTELDRLRKLTKASWWQGRIELERDVVAGWIAQTEGRADAAVALMSRAAEKELAAGKLSVEPGHTFYAVEQMGELLLELARPQEALEAFRRSLDESPRRFHSLVGAGRAAEAAGLNEAAREYYAALTAMVIAGSGRPAVEHAAAFLEKASK